MNKETQNKCIHEARIYIKNRFNNMSNEEYENLCYGDGLLSVADEAIEQFNVEFDDIERAYDYYSKPKFQFHRFRLNAAQTLETANQLYETISQFTNKHEARYFDNYEEYRHHIIGKLKFFVDLYCDLSDNKDTANSYCAFMCQLCQLYPDYDDDSIGDAKDDYSKFIINLIDSLFEVFENDGWFDIDEVHEHINTLDNINFQEQQFIMDCYISECGSYNIKHATGGALYEECDYYDCLKEAAIRDYCKNNDCDKDELLIQELE